MIIRVKKNKNYTSMSNYHLKDKNLSLKAKGLLSIILALPEEWDYSIQGLTSILKENKTAINSALKELKDNNYLVTNKIYPTVENGGRIKYEYVFFENPTDCQESDARSKVLDPRGQDIESLYIENRPQLNTNKLNTNKLNTNININNNYKSSSSYFDNSEVNDLFLEFLDQRKKMKAINSDRAIKMLVDKLNLYDDSTKVQMINQSIVNSWKGIFPLKRETPNKKKSIDEIFDELEEEEKLKNEQK